jgi:acetyl-CoA hydrolase
LSVQSEYQHHAKEPKIMPIDLHPDALDLSAIIRPGDTVLWGQGTSEPFTLTEALVRQRADIGPINVFMGLSFSNTVQPEHADYLSFTSYGGVGTNQRLAKAGLLEILPCHYSQLPALISDGRVKCDVVLIQLTPQNEDGEYSFGAVSDYLTDAARYARVVIAEVNDQAPWTYGGEALKEMRIDYIVRTSRPIMEIKPQPAGEVERHISRHATQYIPDGAVIEMAIGAIPDAVLSALGDRRDLGVHSGMMGDIVMDLMNAGVINNALKPIDRGTTIAGLVFGTSRLYRFVHQNPAVCLRSADYTHNARVIEKLDKFIALNSAIEVDLTGQVNAEIIGNEYIGAIGGQVDFVRASWGSRGGRSIIALPSTAKKNTMSRIVSNLSGGVTTTPRSDADIIVTEWGAAELRGITIRERVRRMIAIAHPDFREQLERDAHHLLRRKGA